MLGRFLELSLTVPQSGPAWQRWLDLRFAAAEAGDIWPHAYGVVACAGLSVGFHAAGDEPLCVSFVRPEVAVLARALADRLIGTEREQLAPEDFHRIELREPGGTLLRVQEARSFSPPPQLPRHTSIGSFRALSLPCPDLAEARGFWERLDYAVHAVTDPWPALAIESLPIAVHETAACRNVLLLFDAAGEFFQHPAPMGLAPTTLPALQGRTHRLLRTPDGVALLQLGAPQAAAAA